MVRIVVDSKLRVAGLPRALADAVREELTLPNPAYISALWGGRWTGNMSETVSLFEQESDGRAILPRGHREALKVRLERTGVQYQVLNRRLDLPRVGLRFHGALRPYQARALETLICYGSGLVVAPPGSGKTVLAMVLSAHWQRPALLLCHTKDLAAQLAENVRRFLQVEPGFVGDGSWNPREWVTVALVQSLTRHPDWTAWLARHVALVLLDEAHHAPAVTFTDVIQSFPAAFRYGLTATPERRDGLGPFVEAVIGPVRARVTAQDLEVEGQRVRPRLRCVETGFRYEYAEDYTAMLVALVQDPERNGLVVDLAAGEVEAGHRTLLLTERIAHAQALAEALERRFPGKSAALTGSVPTKRRAEMLSAFREGRILALTATQLADEGLDVPDLAALILATPSRAPARVAQRVGRLLRPAPGKQAPVVYDLEDSQVPVLKAQAKARWKTVYRDMVAGRERIEYAEAGARTA